MDNTKSNAEKKTMFCFHCREEKVLVEEALTDGHNFGAEKGWEDFDPTWNPPEYKRQQDFFEKNKQ
ncbi:hypothetical protein PROFUN_06993 [Planoprotostelium fungivorum]|uniref:Uncharacterized protein n=1 Tax=Planoprotostelium fungivorum TaxID=1890364 RepID=A0A2P6NMN0_9EUKA|nr:hypothetical protein PROFUN_06993 [Planoprotostelium fungivorum]